MKKENLKLIEKKRVNNFFFVFILVLCVNVNEFQKNMKNYFFVFFLLIN